MKAYSLLFALAAAVAVALNPSAQAADNAESSAELLVQYNFEGIPAYIPNWGGGHGSTYKGATGWHGPFKVSLDKEDPHSGDNAICVEVTEAAAGEIIVHSPPIALPELAEGETRAGAKIIVHAFVRTKGINEGEAGLRILEKNKDGKSLGLLKDKKSFVTIPENPEWNELTFEGELRGGTSTIIFMMAANAQQVPAFVWLDDISIEYVK